jgi:hypothetical protein
VGVVTAAEESWIEPFSGVQPRLFARLVRQLKREGANAPRRGRPWSLPLADRVLLVAAYWRTNLTLRQLAPLFGVSKSAADRIIDDLGPKVVLRPASASLPARCSSSTAHWFPRATARSPRPARTIGTRPTIRSSSTPIRSWSSRSGRRSRATATTARPSASPVPSTPAATMT